MENILPAVLGCGLAGMREVEELTCSYIFFGPC